MPRKFNPYEAQIRSEIKRYLVRGKVDVTLAFEDTAAADVTIRYNRSAAKAYLDYFDEMSSTLGIDKDIRVSTLARMPEVFTAEETEGSDEGLWELIKEALDKALVCIADARAKEGAFLKADLLKKLDEMERSVDFIAARAPQMETAYREKLIAKVHDLLGDAEIDETRIAQEVTIYADKICVDEELVRLRSHIAAVRKTLTDGPSSADEGVGRKLDFLVQEMNRESNTILSKTDDVEISNVGIALKTVVEKIREQIQNLE